MFAEEMVSRYNHYLVVLMCFASLASCSSGCVFVCVFACSTNMQHLSLQGSCAADLYRHPQLDADIEAVKDIYTDSAVSVRYSVHSLTRGHFTGFHFSPCTIRILRSPSLKPITDLCVRTGNMESLMTWTLIFTLISVS